MKGTGSSPGLLRCPSAATGLRSYSCVLGEKLVGEKDVYTGASQGSFLSVTKKSPSTALEAGLSSGLAVVENHHTTKRC